MKQTGNFTFNYQLLIVFPIIIGIYASGIFYLASESAIPLTIFQLTLVTGFIAFFLKKILSQDTSIYINGLEFWFLSLFTLIYFSTIYTPERSEALFYSIRFFVLVLFSYLILNLIESKKDLISIAYFIVIAAAIVSIVSIIQTVLNPEILAINYLYQGKTIIRESGVEKDPNVYASHFIIPLMISVSAFLSSKKKITKLLFFLALIVILITVVTTYSRSVWLSIITGFSIILWKYKRIDFALYLILTGVLLIIVIPEARTLALSALERFKDIFAGTNDDSSNTRIILGLGSVYMFFDSYLMGVGFQGFSTAFQKYFTIQETIGVYEPHNVFYTFYAELGLIGLFLLVIIFKKIISTSYKNIKNKVTEDSFVAIGLFSSFISYIVFYQFYGGMMYNSLIFLLIGLIYAEEKITTHKLSYQPIYTKIGKN